MAATAEPDVVQAQLEEVTPYSMHVSSRYLELTKKKLQFTRLPREIGLPEARRWDLGTPKAVLEPLLDYWLETYDWRTQESTFNTTLPQFRTTIKIDVPRPHAPSSRPSSSASAALAKTTPQSLRIHFVHKRSKHKTAIPLLFCHGYPSSFIEVQKIIDALTDPQSLPSFGAGAQQAFHVVAPSIPGFGFSDAATVEGFGLKETAQAFDMVMGRLGYEGYVAHGMGWGFNICRALALDYPERCLAVHTANPTFPEPTLRRSPAVWLKHRIARLTRGRFLSFGYTPAEVQPQSQLGSREQGTSSSHDRSPVGATLSPLYALRPQTLVFSLCDSPIGLLAGMLDMIHTRAPRPTSSSASPVTSRSRSPFLSPVELEMEGSYVHGSIPEEDEHEPRSGGTERPRSPFSPRDAELNARAYTWSPTEVLNWTMLHWLPGPEGSLRWLRNATLDARPTTPFSTRYCPVPLGISSFQARNSCTATSTPLMWGSASWCIAWVKRHQRPATVSPAWEAPDLLVLDIRECFGSWIADGTVHLPETETTAT